jgi:glycyl-tRNA synthetase
MDIFEKVTALAKRRGFIYPGSEIYGGLAGTWDYGPLGVELKRNLKEEFWKFAVRNRDNVVGIDAAIIMNPKVWEASGHLASFSDPLVECKKCHARFRVDNLDISENDFLVTKKEFLGRTKKVIKELNEEMNKSFSSVELDINRAKLLLEVVKNSKNIEDEERSNLLEIAERILKGVEKNLEYEPPEKEITKFLIGEIERAFKYEGLITQTYLNRFIACPTCDSMNNWTEPKQFNLMVETYLGVVEGEKTKTYLRGEITQGVHVNFKNVLSSTRVKLPFGVAQVGKAFRNEITPGGFTFRSREFEQMEIQFYVKPEEEESMKWFEYWKEERTRWYCSLGMRKENLRFKEHDQLAHYARAAYDIEYNAGWMDSDASVGAGWKEMEGIHHRGDWDVKQHELHSKQDMTYFDEETKERYLPWTIETSGGVDRAALFFLMDAYREEKLEGGEERTVLKLHPKLAPYKAAVFPLLANKPQLVALARKIYTDLRGEWMIAWDERGNIGKRYRTQDEAGTPFCFTVDFDSLEKDDVTVRERDSMKQERIKIKDIHSFLSEKIK